MNTFSLCPEKNWININSHVLASVAVHFSSAPSPKAETHRLRQCKLAYEESENGHRYRRYKVAYILELHSTFNIKQIDYKSTKESILHIQQGSGQARVQQRRMVEVGAC